MIVYVDVVRIGGSIRQVRHGQKRVLVKDIALDEALQQVPRHWDWDCYQVVMAKGADASGDLDINRAEENVVDTEQGETVSEICSELENSMEE